MVCGHPREWQRAGLVAVPLQPAGYAGGGRCGQRCLLGAGCPHHAGHPCSTTRCSVRCLVASAAHGMLCWPLPTCKYNPDPQVQTTHSILCQMLRLRQSLVRRRPPWSLDDMHVDGHEVRQARGKPLPPPYLPLHIPRATTLPINKYSLVLSPQSSTSPSPTPAGLTLACAPPRPTHACRMHACIRRMRARTRAAHSAIISSNQQGAKSWQPPPAEPCCT